MKTKTTTIFVLAILLAGTAIAQTSDRLSTQLEGTLLTSDPVPLQSGEDGDVSFKITNNGNTKAEDVKVEIMDQYPFKLKPGRKRNYSIGTVAPGQSYYISTELLVNEKASDGSHDLKIRISQEDFSQIEEIPLEVQSEDIELNLANLKTSPSQLMPDTEDNKLTLEIVNNGEKTAENVAVNLKFPDFFQKTSSFSTRQALGNIKPGEVKKADFNFDITKSAPKGSVDISATIKYSSGDSTAEIEKEETFQTFISGKPQYKVINYSSNLKQGESGEIKIKIKNVGEEKSTSTRIRVLDSSDLPFSYSSSSKFVGTLEPGKTGTAVFDVTTESDAEPKQYLLDFEIRGVKNTEVFTKDTTIDVEVDKSRKKASSLPIPEIAVALLLLAGAYLLTGKFRDKE